MSPRRRARRGWSTGFSSRGWSPYVPVAERRRRAAREMAKLKKDGRTITPVEIAGRTIAETFWGQAWCHNLESYSDYANRLPRGRSYVRNGSVMDLQIAAGRVTAIVSGSQLYEIEVKIKKLAKPRWDEIKSRCAGQIGSLVELLRGSIAKGVMEIVTRKGEGLFPAPREIAVSCSCPDWARMCKHVAATLYGVGARLDHAPELLFTLRGVDATEMVETAVTRRPTRGGSRKSRVLRADELSAVFGIDLDAGEATGAKKVKAGKRAGKKVAAKRATKRVGSKGGSAEKARGTGKSGKKKARKVGGRSAKKK